jgi:hypothetical protein
MGPPPKAISAVWTARARSETNTAAAPPSRWRSPSSRASSTPLAESAPGSQPVAMPASLSVVSEWVSKTISIGMVSGPSRDDSAAARRAVRKPLGRLQAAAYPRWVKEPAVRSISITCSDLSFSNAAHQLGDNRESPHDQR